MCKTETGDRRNFRCDRGNRQLFFGFFLPNHRFGGRRSLRADSSERLRGGSECRAELLPGRFSDGGTSEAPEGRPLFFLVEIRRWKRRGEALSGKGALSAMSYAVCLAMCRNGEGAKKKPAVGTVGCKKASRGMRPDRFCRGNQRSMTPDPTSSSPSYHAANCPAVTPR